MELITTKDVKEMLEKGMNPIDVSIEKYRRIKRYIMKKRENSDWTEVLNNINSAGTCGLCMSCDCVCDICKITEKLDKDAEYLVKVEDRCGCEFTPWNKLIEELSEGEQDWKEILYLVNKEIKFLEGLKNEKHN